MREIKMETKRFDRRVKYTKMVIRDSFVKLLKQKPITKISVKEICEDADINRATFYAHYMDQHDLLRQITGELIDDINQYLGGHDFKDNALVPVEITEKILEYIKENSEIFALLLNTNGDMRFQQEVIKIIGGQHFIPAVGNDSLNREDAEYIFHFLACGAVGVIQKWLSGDMKKSPKEIASLILRIAIHGKVSFEL